MALGTLIELRTLGRSSVKITPLVMGSWGIGGWMWGGTNETDSIDAIKTSIANGIITIDTAAIYGMGYSEEMVGKAIKGQRDKVVIATKCGMRWDGEEGTDPFPAIDSKGKSVTVRRNSKPASIIKECEQSLKRLGTDVIDLYQIHWPDSSTPIEDSWNAMIKLKQEGKVRAIGVSNYNLEQLKRAYAVAPVDSIQLPYSLIRRIIEKDIVPFCQKNQIAILAYSPLERGLLTGNVPVDRKFPKDDHRATNPLFSTKNRKLAEEALEKIRSIAETHDATYAQIILNCTLFRPGITGTLAGARNAKQARENARAATLSLRADERTFVLEMLDDRQLQQPLYNEDR